MVFLDISKAFDRVWHSGLIHKLESLGIKNPLLNWFRSYLSNRYQHVVIDSECSNWVRIEACVPQGSVLGPLLFLIFINDISDSLATNCFLYADDTTLFEVVENPLISSAHLNSDIIRKLHGLINGK